MELAEPFASKFAADTLTLFKTEHWSVLVRKGQSTLGSLVLAQNRNTLSGAELTPEELAEYPKVISRLETALASAFQFDRINYLCLMMVDRHYHFHIFPRYEAERRFGGRDWKDETWPGLPVVGAPAESEEFLQELRDHLAAHLPD